MTPRMLLLEFNELCPPLIERFMRLGNLPNFVRLQSQSEVFVTNADELPAYLHPWLQWVTVHTGVGYGEHGVLTLGQGAALRHPTVGDVVSDAGETVWLCGPMNVVPTHPVRGTWLPDPWNPDESSVPPELAPIASFIRSQVREHSNVSKRMSPTDHLRFLWGMGRHGLSGATMKTVVGQLVGERTGRRDRWRRAALLDHFQWDLFEHIYRGDRPTFATYFSNTTAHYQHYFWRYMEPDAFEVKPTPQEIETYGPAIRSGYVEMDRLVGRALDLIDERTTLVLCTALSQHPYLEREDQGGSRYYRPRDFDDFVRRLGLTRVTSISSIMSEQFCVRFDDEASAIEAEFALRGAVIDSSRAFDVLRTGTEVLVGIAETTDLPAGAVIRVPGTGTVLDIEETTYRAETPKSGAHHPDGALWISTPERRHEVHAEPVSLRSVAPTLLALMDLDPPDSMRSPVLVASQRP